MELKEMEAIPDFTGHKYVINMMDPNFILPRGPCQKDEFSDTVYHKNTEVPYHWHEHGFETFEIAKGSVDCVINGQHFIAQAGDLLHIPPYTAHGFVFLEEGTIWRELFQEMDMSGGIFEKNIVNRYYATFKEDDAFMAMYRAGKTVPRQRPVIWDQPSVDHTKVFQCRTSDFAWKTYEGDGYSIKLKICKWETAGCKEIWHADVKKGLKVDYDYPHKGYDLFYVQSGKLEITIKHSYTNAEPMTFIAEDDSIIDIPPYHTYTIRVLEDAALYNYGGEYNLEACLEDLASMKQSTPELFNDPASYLAFLRKYGVYATDMTYEKQVKTSDTETEPKLNRFCLLSDDSAVFMNLFFIKKFRGRCDLYKPHLPRFKSFYSFVKKNYRPA